SSDEDAKLLSWVIAFNLRIEINCDFVPFSTRSHRSRSSCPALLERVDGFWSDHLARSSRQRGRRVGPHEFPGRQPPAHLIFGNTENASNIRRGQAPWRETSFNGHMRFPQRIGDAVA